MLAERLDGDKKRAAAALDAVIDTVYAAVAKGERVVLTGFGVFEKRERAARTARNPATGAAVKVKKTSVPAFRAGAEFRAITSGAKKVAKAPANKAAAAKRTTAAKAPAAAKASAAKGTAAKRTTAKATSARSTANATPTKTAARKTAAKAPAKKAATKAPAKKTTAKKAPAKRTSR